MQKVIGLDIGSYSIKAIEIVNTFKSYEITNFYETVIPNLEGVPLDAIVPVCMEQLFQEHNLSADRIITAMPGQFISSRIIPFAFSDPRKIEQSIFYELEDHVPFHMEEMLVDHQILGSANNQTLALAVMTRKVFLRNFLDLLARIDIDPKLVDVDSLAFYNLSSCLQIQDDDCVALVDIGNEKTSVCIIHGGVLRMFRSINLGGRYITDFLARDLQVSFHEAQRIKHRVSRILLTGGDYSNLSEDERFVSERMTLASNAIVKELGRTFYSYKNWDKTPLNRIILSGGTPKMRDFDKFLAEQLEVQVEKFTLAQTSLIVNPDLQLHEQSLPQSLAIGLRAVSNVRQHSQINLRRGEFAYVQNYESLMKAGSLGFKVIAVLMFVLLSTYLIKYYFYSSQIEELKQQYKKEFVAEFPELRSRYRKANMTFSKLQSDAENRFKQAIAEKQDAILEFQTLSQQSPALELLRDMSKTIPEDIKVDITLFDFKLVMPGVGKFILKADTDNFASQAAIVEALGKIEELKNIEEKQSGAKPGSDGRVIEFTVHADYEAARL